MILHNLCMIENRRTHFFMSFYLHFHIKIFVYEEINS